MNYPDVNQMTDDCKFSIILITGTGMMCYAIISFGEI